jgi:broad specificity phosphatase PhoE
MNLFLVRHGEIVSNIKKIYAGTSDEGLTRKGRYQAEQVAKVLKNKHIQTLLTSPVQRALETAQIIGRGPWEGKSESRVSRVWPREWHIWNQRPAELKLPGRETLDELLRRVLKGVRQIRRHAKDGNHLIITHVAVIRVLLIWHAGESLNSYRSIPVPNAKVMELEINPSLSLP